ncbi:MAG: hypothetical protein IPK77_13285 [Cellvibrio sp.]|jgi:hypothetical protein|nr:hypothetical protein [Cellvibrio sp.]
MYLIKNFKIRLLIKGISFAILCLAIKANAECDTALQRSSLMLTKIIDDLNKTYTWTGGGGISEIVEVASGEYQVSLPQEERVDQFQYQLEINKKCEVIIVKKEYAVKSFKR